MSQLYDTHNLTLFRDWLIANREQVEHHLRMADFCTAADGDIVDIVNRPASVEQAVSCGTNLCLVGWAGVSGVPELVPLPADEYWVDYSERVFFYGDRACACVDVNHAWDYLFAPHQPNDFDAALERLNFAIEHGTCPGENNHA